MNAAPMQIVTARRARRFLVDTGTPARLPRIGVRLMVSREFNGLGVESWIVERRPGAGAARYSIVRVRNAAIDASVPT